ncbi:NAD(P) transhydrogenase subunit alpha [Falsiroseomonas tokyonensis]|uniref:proton-translocating NAD(P)(+) transhydrogenase n=1 Tax=Falsiroseomonas tokyonensis TaxID=430521 RepID=A0ABV7BWJ7_9PROT|nr:NAD(P) transhydrogenase subunit alpha [Falsiroseomonas tokyonensis]MBU8539811.1 NAD(P) transhydrogenase subunit alpha [Falsiroseomonas tokyonensis]
MNPQQIANEAASLSDRAAQLAEHARQLAEVAAPVAAAAEPFLLLLTIFLMACFVGYYVVWNVTPALHSPLMGVTNAISSVIVVGAILATGLADSWAAKAFGFIAVTLASVNIFGGFMVTRRMLAMFKKKGS